MWVFIDADQAPMDESVGADGAVIQLVTRCESEDEFIERFARFATPTDVVVPALPHVAAGASGRFVIRLKDQSTIMAGRCEVSEVVPMAAPPGAPPQSGRSLMRLRLIDMDARSRGVHLRLLERRASASKPAPPPPAPPPAVVVRPTTAPSLSIVRPPPPTPPPVVTAPPPVAPPPVSAPAARIPLPGSTMNVMTTARPPLRRQAAPMPTLIGTPATFGLAGASFSVATAPPLADLETTEVSAIPKLETRAPSAALTLPANPLSDLDAEDLASFVEFQLNETENADSANLTGKVKVDPEAATAAAALPESAPAGAAPTGVVPVRATAKVRLDKRLERAVEIGRKGWPYASCVVLGLVLGLAFRSSGKVAAVPAAPPAAAAPATAVPAPTPSPEIAPPAAPAPAPAVAARKAAAIIPGDCTARVMTTPPDASVVWGDVPLGTGRNAHASVPCGKAVVTIRHDRYADVTRTMTAQPGQVTTLSERLHRPPAKVTIASVPPRAHIKMNRRAIGAAPRHFNTNRFEQIRIDASLPGYQPWSKTVYLRQAETKIDVELVAIPKPAARSKSARPNVK